MRPSNGDEDEDGDGGGEDDDGSDGSGGGDCDMMVKMTEHLPNMHKTLWSIPSNKNTHKEN